MEGEVIGVFVQGFSYVLLALLHIAIINQETPPPEKELSVLNVLVLDLGGELDSFTDFVQPNHSLELVTEHLHGISAMVDELISVDLHVGKLL